MYICKQDAERILEVINKFPDAESFYLEADSSSGIGSIITLTIVVSVNGLSGEFKTEISGVENW